MDRPLILGIIEASTSGHTSFVVDCVVEELKELIPQLSIRRVRAERATVQDLEGANALVFGSGTWNTNGTEGQLNPVMHEFLTEKLKGVAIKKPMAFVSLGDDRYYFTTRCTEHFLRFQRSAGAPSLLAPLIIVNEPYDQREKIRTWAIKLSRALEAL